MIIPKFYKTILTLEDTEVNLRNETSVNITCQLIDYNNNPVVNEEVIIKIDGTEVTTENTNSNGMITYTYDCSNLGEGYYTINANEARATFRILYVGDWQELTLASGYTHYQSDNHLSYRRVGNIVEVRGVVKKSGTQSANTNYKKIATLPVGFRPESPIDCQHQGSGENRVEWQVTADGSIQWRDYGTTSNINMPDTAWLNIHFIFSI